MDERKASRPGQDGHARLERRAHGLRESPGAAVTEVTGGRDREGKLGPRSGVWSR